MSYRSTLLQVAALILLAAPSMDAAPPAVRVDAAGDPLPDGAVARLGTTRWRPGKDVVALACSPDGRLTASGGADGTVRLWETDTGRLVRTMWGCPQYVLSVCFSPDGNTLLSGNGQVACLWEVATGKVVRRFPMPGHVTAVSFADQGKVVVGISSEGAICRWRSETGEAVRRFRFPGRFAFPTLSPDGGLVVSEFRPNDRGLFRFAIWDTATGKEWPVVDEEHFHRPSAFSPDGSELVVLDGIQILFCDTATGKEKRKLPHQGIGGYCLAFAPDGKTFAVEGEKMVIHLRDTRTGKVVRAFRGRQHNVRPMAFTPDGKRLLSSTAELTIQVWDVATGEQIVAGAGPEGYLGSIAFAPDGKTLLAGAFDRGIRLWDTSTGKELHRFEGQPEEVTLAAAYSSDGKMVAAGGGGKVIQVWDVAERRRLFELTGSEVVYSLVFAPDGKRLYSAGFEKEIRRWDLTNGKPLPSLTGVAARTLNISRDGKLLVSSGYDGMIRLWNTATGKEQANLKGHDDFILGMCLSTDNAIIASAGRDGTIRIWDTVAAKEIRRWPAPNSHTLALTPDGKHIATASGKVVRLYETATGKELPPLVGHRDTVDYVAFSADGSRLASGGHDTAVLIWDSRRLLGKGPPQRVALEPGEWDVRWEELTSMDELPIADALALMAADGPATIERLRGKLREIGEEGSRYERLLTNLADKRFAVRERTMEEFRLLGAAAEPALRDALARARDLDLRNRLQTLLRDVPPGTLASPQVRSARIIRLLERIATPEAQQLRRDLGDEGKR